MAVVSCPACNQKLQIGYDQLSEIVGCPECTTAFEPVTGRVVSYPEVSEPEPPPVQAPKGPQFPSVVEPQRRPAYSVEPHRPERTQRRGGPAGFRCVYCNTDSPPLVKQKVSTAGWVIFCVLLTTCILSPLALVGLFIKEDYRVCSSCGITLG